ILYDFGNRSIPSLFSINQEFPNLQLRIVPSGEPFYSEQFPENHLIVTLFSPICPLCSIMKRLDTLKSIKRSIKQNNTEIKIILIFSEPFDGNDVETWNRLVQMPFEKYITEDIFPEDVKYITDDKLRPDPVTIILEKKRRVVFYEGADSDEKWLQNEIMKFIAVEIK
ncbi:hypothetical protein MUO66_07920, partial [Candidatus Bathyarchaeota archaeon]|nr:hypothetical protein [Candidatus Bathyarchaeota archaeon]